MTSKITDGCARELKTGELRQVGGGVYGVGSVVQMYCSRCHVRTNWVYSEDHGTFAVWCCEACGESMQTEAPQY